jgi:hypothetical protein
VAAEGQFESFAVATLPMLRTALATRTYARTIGRTFVPRVGSALGIVVDDAALANVGDVRRTTEDD